MKIVKIFQSEVKKLENIPNKKMKIFQTDITLHDYEHLKNYKVSLALTNQ